MSGTPRRVLNALALAGLAVACVPAVPPSAPAPALASTDCTGGGDAELIYSNARRSRETGDISGIELALHWNARTVTGSFRVARGEFMGSHPVSGVSLGGGRVALVLSEGRSELRLDGRLTCEELLGVWVRSPEPPKDSVSFRRVERRGQLPRWPQE
jgi:hypothetical protein